MLPGVAIVDMVYRTAEKYLETTSVFLKNIVFSKPIVTDETFDQQVTIRFIPDDNYYRLEIFSQKIKGDIPSPEQELNMECELHSLAVTEGFEPNVDFNVNEFIKNATSSIDIDELYKVAKDIGVYHSDFMKTQGTIYQQGRKELMEVNLSEFSETYRMRFYLHPAFMDTATFAGVSTKLGLTAPVFNKTQDSAFIPIFIAKISAFQPLPGKIYIYSESTIKERNNDDLNETDIRIYNAQGTLLVSIEKLTTKKIRQPALIENLVQDNSTKHQQPGDAGNPASISMTKADSTSPTEDTIKLFLKTRIAAILARDIKTIDVRKGFYDLGLDSGQLLSLVKDLENYIGKKLYPTLLFEYKTIDTLCQYIITNHASTLVATTNSQTADSQAALFYLSPMWRKQAITAHEKSSAKLERYLIISDQLAHEMACFESIAGAGKIISLVFDESNIANSINNNVAKVFNCLHPILMRNSGAIFQIIGFTSASADWIRIIIAIFKTANLESNNISAQLILLDPRYDYAADDFTQILDTELSTSTTGVEEIRYQGKSNREIASFELTTSQKAKTAAFENDDVYLISGGAGGIGLQLAKYIASKANVKLALLGRRKPTQAIQDALAQIATHGSQAQYYSVDIGNPRALNKTISNIRQDFGNINGVIHCAGINKDKYLINKNSQEIESVLAPKIDGTLLLDELTQSDPVKFFVLFSSLSGAFGNIGQADYAAANAFLDNYARHRQSLVSKKVRNGKTISINWPIWKEGGMGISENMQEDLRKTVGLTPLPSGIAFSALENIIANCEGQLLLLYGLTKNLQQHFTAGVESNPPLPAIKVADTQLEHPAALIEFTGKKPEQAPQIQAHENITNAKMHEQERQQIAIIGIAGKYPKATDINSFYENLQQGADCITGLPLERWSQYDFGYKPEAVYDFGGFLADVDLFDPLFFNISPRSAYTLDPQARLFLEASWHACQDAGFLTRSMYTHTETEMEKNVGVFAGVFWCDYELYAAVSVERGRRLAFGNSASTVANLTSHSLDFNGPSLAIDTMCSSSLSAIFLARESLLNNHCEFALAGGVNVITHPHRLTFLTDAGFLSSDGKCRSFGDGGSGYVPGEGVGVVLMTSLVNAKQKNYHIYGVIQGAAINHTGKTSGVSVPDPVSQAAVISAAINDARLNAQDIDYVEAHGTGTSLGDPIEINGLSKAFSGRAAEKKCFIGSVKSNLGHLEAAAGIAGLTKILLQYKYRTLFPSLHAQSLNQNIPFEDSCFTVLTAQTPWPDADKIKVSGLSSFGASGSNAHVIISEYHNPPTTTPLSPTPIIPLSARNNECLHQYITALLGFAKTLDNEQSFANLTQTLCFARDAMDARIAFVVSDIGSFTEVLDRFLTGHFTTDNRIIYNQDDASDNELGMFDDEDIQDTIGIWVQKSQWNKIAKAWVKGINVSWSKTLNNTNWKKISCPVPPLANKKYWAPLNLPLAPVGQENFAEDAMTNPQESTTENQEVKLKASPMLKEEKAKAAKLGIDPGSAIDPEAIYQYLATSLDAILFLDGEWDKSKQFVELGLDSILGVEWVKKINSHWSLNLKASSLYDAPNLPAFAALVMQSIKDNNHAPSTMDDASLIANNPLPHKIVDQATSLQQSAQKLVLNNQYIQGAAVQKPAIKSGTRILLSDLDGEQDLKPQVQASEPSIKKADSQAEHVYPNDKEIVSINVLVEEVTNSFAKIMLMEREEVTLERSFVEMGLDSIIGVEWVRELNHLFAMNLKATVLYDHASIPALAKYIFAENTGSVAINIKNKQVPEVSGMPSEQAIVNYGSHDIKTTKNAHKHSSAAMSFAPLPDNKIAIVGQSGRYPGASSLDDYWQNLYQGINSIEEIPASRWDVNLFYSPHQQPGKIYSKWLGILADIEFFDPLFFNISPLEAQGIDPQQRLFLQEAYHAFEDAGYSPEYLSNTRCGVYLGIMNNEYSKIVAYHDKEGSRSNTTGNSYAIAAARIAYYLNLRGPAIPIDTACSSSLVGVHLASQALRLGEVDMALVGGVTLYLIPESYIGMCSAGMLSKDGQCKTFDKGADGFVPGEGVGCLILKRFSDALRDNDNIHGLIIGSGINQDGKTNGITAPSMQSQLDLETSIYTDYGIDVETIDFAELHGTGTQLGDPIELEALSKAFSHFTPKKNYCGIGSVKTNIGHTSAAAGIASVQKVILAMHNNAMPATLNITHENPHFDFANSPFYINKKLTPWPATASKPRRATVSSFGFSGTNAHLVLQDFAGHALPENGSQPELIILSARTEAALLEQAKNILAALEAGTVARLVDTAFTLQVGRAPLKCRLAFVATSIEAAQDALRDYIGKKQSVVRTSKVDTQKLEMQFLGEKPEILAQIQQALGQRNLDQLALFWLQGSNIDWKQLYKPNLVQKISLPGYPFAKELCWVQPVIDKKNQGSDVINSLSSSPTQHNGPNTPSALPTLPGENSNLRNQALSVEECSTTGANQDQLKPGAGNPELSLAALRNPVMEFLKEDFSKHTNIAVEDLDEFASFESYGFDSIMAIAVTTTLEKKLGRVSKTLLFEYQNLNDLCSYLVNNYPNALADTLQIKTSVLSLAYGVTATHQPPDLNSVATSDAIKHHQVAQQHQQQDIAVIGAAGSYAQAKNIDEYWNNLTQEKDCITEISDYFWKHSEFVDSDKSIAGKTYARWGGFIPGVDQFDALFFNISPREAALMDPQERLFLQCVYHTLENAGYTANALNNQGKVGIFVGVMYQEYQLYSFAKNGFGYALQGNPSSVANRSSFYFNFQGPSLSVDTMCSSSLTAIHLACQSIKNRECDSAIAGGTNVSIHLNKFLLIGQTGFASSAGRCKSFGEGGDGYVPGEGIGAVLLKSLTSAETRGDRILGVIKASAINHGGKTNGYTVPSPKAQAHLIQEVLTSANIAADTISYIEAHGTGTALGDPIEIEGLSQAFNTSKRQFCAIGSVKSNIGHCESAAGIAALTKVLLQFKYKKLVPSLHSRTTNTHIDFASTPFYVQQTLSDWLPISNAEQDAVYVPRRAGISAFGAGGSNSHLILEEYIDQRDFRILPSSFPAVFIFSARSPAQLKTLVQAYIENFKLNKHLMTAADLLHIAHTLQVGRESMDERLGVIASTLDELIQSLQNFINDTHTTNLVQGNVKKSRKEFKAAIALTENIDAIWSSLIAQGKFANLLELWVKGFEVEWYRLYTSSPQSYKRVELPLYPFDNQRCWVGAAADTSSPDTGKPINGLLPIGKTDPVKLHPLVHNNTLSTEAELHFSSCFSLEDDYIKDHRVNGNTIVAAAIFGEMIRWVGTRIHAKGREFIPLDIIDFTLVHPLVIKDAHQIVFIKVNPDNHDCEIYTRPDGGPLVHCRAKVLPCSELQVSTSLPTTLLQNSNKIDVEKLYRDLANAGFQYGDTYKSLVNIQAAQHEVLAEIGLPPSSLSPTDCLLHPVVTDAALMSCSLLVNNNAEPQIPFAIDNISIYGKCTQRVWVKAKKANNSTHCFDIEIYNDERQLIARIDKFYLRPVRQGLHLQAATNKSTLVARSLPANTPGQTETLLYKPVWEKHDSSRHFCEDDNAYALIGFDLDIFQHAIGDALPTDCKTSFYTSDKVTSIDSFYDYVEYLCGYLKQHFLKTRMQPSIVQVLVPIHFKNVLLSGLSAAIKTARQENPQCHCHIIAIDTDDVNIPWAELLKQYRRDAVATEIIYSNGIAQSLHWQLINHAAITTQIWKVSASYLISGGAGALGLLLAEEIIKSNHHAKVILLGRSGLSPERHDKIGALGSNVIYKQVDLGDEIALERIITEIDNSGFPLKGVIHSAGVLKDSMIIKKSPEQIQHVFLPKVKGTYNLDKATKNSNLDFFVCFSSVAGALGNHGQFDYAAANGFLRDFAIQRNTATASGERNGHTLTIAWPLWESDGMQMPEEVLRNIKAAGIEPLNQQHGLMAFYQALASGESQVLIFAGVLEKISQWLPGSKRHTAKTEAIVIQDINNNPDTMCPPLKTAQIEQLVRDVLGKVLSVPAKYFDADSTFDAYGINSIAAVEITRAFEKIVGPLPKILMFEQQTLSELCRFFENEHAATLAAYLQSTAEISLSTSDIAETARMPFIDAKHSEASFMEDSKDNMQNNKQDIAIIGLAGQYPDAKNIKEFWDNISSSKDCIHEIPAHRWDHKKWIAKNKKDPGKTYARWGGFLEDMECFDPLFFNISPREAIAIDPQERLFLQCAKHTLEDAGYTAKVLNTQGDVGVFVGVMYNEYQLYSHLEDGRGFALPGNPSSVANRVSHFFNLHGPSMALDTMCSSSLTAIFLACQSIATGACHSAIAGGVNLSVHINKFLLIGATGFASTKGRCESFGEGGDGYVPGEAVGAVLLKSLSRAEQDNDHIYGVIKSCVVNHGGKTHGYTVPNPKAQAELIKRAISQANIPADTINYIEAHGTGTALGDPIEISGLIKAFNSGDKKICAIGSVKSNIGHCESAAGIAGLTKVLLQLKYKTLIPTLHTTTLNKNINFDQSPFYIQRETSPWLQIDSQIPRRAGISAFGASGSNAHLIVEEYMDTRAGNSQDIVSPIAIVISAKSNIQLQQIAKDLAAFIEHHEAQTLATHQDLKNLAYTLQIGRDQLECRFAVVVHSCRHLINELQSFIAHPEQPGNFYTGTVNRHQHPEKLHDLTQQINQNLLALFSQGDWAALLGAWVQGVDIPWFDVYKKMALDKHFFRISLPGYPFAKVRCWPEPIGTYKQGQTIPSTNPASNGNEPPQTSPAEPSALPAGLAGIALEWLTDLFSREMLIDKELLLPEAPLHEYGVDSIRIAHLVAAMEVSLGNVALEPNIILEYPTLGELAHYIAENHAELLPHFHTASVIPTTEGGGIKTQVNPIDTTPRLSLTNVQKNTVHNDQRVDKRVAVIGVACHFPDAKNIKQFWENLASGKDSIREIPRSRWDWQEIHKNSNTEPYKWGAFLDNIEDFDPAYFLISEAEALQIDPLIRQWLEVSAEAMADAGLEKKDLSGKRVGVFAGARTGTFAYYAQRSGGMPTISGTTQNFIAAYLSQVYNMRGPNMVVDTACSSALTAIHLAVQSIRQEESSIALAGGVEILLDSSQMLSLGSAQVLSKDGRCKTFDESADGIGLGEGCGIIVLKSFNKAIEENNKIYGVIEGSAINIDGRTMGITTPNPEAQKEVIEYALADAGIDPGTITYIETHGTGTRIGDPIELRSLTHILKGQHRQVCGVGSVKSNVGHLLSAAGAVGIIKILLSLVQKQLPPTLHCKKPNPRFKFAESPLYPVLELQQWKGVSGVLRAGISSFGMGGNNAHIIISDEGIPDRCRATFNPKGESVKFARKRFWHGKADAPPHSEIATELLVKTDDVYDDEFAEFLEN